MFSLQERATGMPLLAAIFCAFPASFRNNEKNPVFESQMYAVVTKQATK
jgi:hypothetical protein